METDKVLDMESYRNRKLREDYDKIEKDAWLCDRIIEDINTLPDNHVARIWLYCRKILKKEEESE